MDFFCVVKYVSKQLIHFCSPFLLLVDAVYGC